MKDLYSWKESSCVGKFSKTKIKEFNEISSFDAQIGHTCVNYGCVCITEEKGEKSLTKEEEREGKGRQLKPKERALVIPLLTNLVW